MNILLFSDLHITKQDLPECISILEEIISLCNEHKINKIIILGDSFDSLHPDSDVLDIFAQFIKKLGDREIIILIADSHESETKQKSILNHYGILAENIKLMKEYQDDDYMYCGHFIIKEAKKNFGATKSKNDLKKYKFVFLGHQHEYEIIKPNICQLGSCRFVDFGELNE